jgi:2-oxoglutarate dehydrogenase E1 component
MWFDWNPYMNQEWWDFADTTFNPKEFAKLGSIISSIPEGFELQKPVTKLFEDRQKMNNGEAKINWGFAEIMAYATLLHEGYPVRLTGQDVRRGTFSHRHAVVHNKIDGNAEMPLLQIAQQSKTNLEIYDSLLSEEAVLGFEYGYSATWPSGLVIWEAQFGDFANGAQVVIDQFIVSAEHKWERLSGLVMLLPHGYEGQGPEHSSARLERFLQLCAFKNIQVCVPSTPSQIFHLLRQQAKRNLRKPLVIFSPKSLLRNPDAVSTLEDLTNGTYELVINDGDDEESEIKRVVMCSGKLYYDLKTKQRELEDKTTALIRIEQLYPFPYDELEDAIKKYPNVSEFIWAQEEPANQGAWFSHRHRIQRVLDRLKKNFVIDLKSRPAAAAPAVGLNKLHVKQQQELVNQVFSVSEKIK